MCQRPATPSRGQWIRNTINAICVKKNQWLDTSKFFYFHRFIKCDILHNKMSQSFVVNMFKSNLPLRQPLLLQVRGKVLDIYKSMLRHAACVAGLDQYTRVTFEHCCSEFWISSESIPQIMFGANLMIPAQICDELSHKCVSHNLTQLVAFHICVKMMKPTLTAGHGFSFCSSVCPETVVKAALGWCKPTAGFLCVQMKWYIWSDFF